MKPKKNIAILGELVHNFLFDHSQNGDHLLLFSNGFEIDLAEERIMKAIWEFIPESEQP